MTDKGHIDKLARLIWDRRTDPPGMTGTSTAGGTDLHTRQDRLPMPIGTPGQVLTVVDDGGDNIPSWEDPTAAVIAELDDIGDVNAPTPANGDVLTWDSTPGEWVATAPTGGSYSDDDVIALLLTNLLPGNNIDITEVGGVFTVAVEALTESDIASLVSDLAALSAASHAAATVLDSANIDLGISGQQITANLTTAARTFTINFVIDGGGSVITTGIKGDIVIDRACTITAWTALADVGGAIVVDIWGDVYGSYPPVVGDSITTSEKPTITATNTKGQDTSLNSGAGWAIAAGTVLRFNVDSITTCTRVTIALTAVAS